MPTAANLRVERLALQLPDVGEADGRRLARLIGEGLAASSLPGGGANTALDRLNVHVTARPGDTMETLARQVVADLLRQLERTL